MKVFRSLLLVSIVDVAASVNSIEHVFEGVALGQVNVAQALTSLDAYTTQLAERVAHHEYNLTTQDTEALEQIRRYISGMFNTSEVQFKEDQDEVDSRKAAIELCSSTAQGNLDGKVSEWEAGTDEARVNHTSCRTKQVTLTDTRTSICDAYDNYRTSSVAVPPVCVPTDLTAADVATTDLTDLKAMEVCLDETKIWLDPLHDEYIKCNKAETDVTSKDGACDGKQDILERYFCSWVDHHDTTCEDQDACRDTETAARSKTHAAVKVAESARKADWVTGKHVECLFGVFEAGNEDKQSILTGCLKTVFNLDGISINYHDIPAATTCVKKPHKPCDQAFLDAEYTQTVWYPKAPTAACSACITVR
jgi:hypothetical protein